MHGEQAPKIFQNVLIFVLSELQHAFASRYGQWWRAGQAVVQIAEDVRSRREYAFKFFISPVAFEQEARLYEDPEQPLGRFLPELRCILDKSRGNELHDRTGTPLPPCIVMEKGEALDLFTARSEDGLDMVTGLQVCSTAVQGRHDARQRCMHVRVCCLAARAVVSGQRIKTCTLGDFNVRMSCTAGADSCGRAAEGPARCGVRAPRHQAWQHHVAAAPQPLDTHRLWVRGQGWGRRPPILQPHVCAP